MADSCYPKVTPIRTALGVALAFAVAGLSMTNPANATTCEEFTARVIEGAAYYKMPVPGFELATVNSYDPDRRFFNITFGNVRALMKCNHGWVGTFDVDANDPKAASTAYIASLIAISLYGYGWDWRGATDLRDELVREAKAPSQMAERIIDDTKVSLIISSGGVASFAISPDAITAAAPAAASPSTVKSNIPRWKTALPGTRAFLSDDGGGANTATVCETADRYRDWLNYESAPGCHAFQHGLKVVIEVVLLDEVRDKKGLIWQPLVKIAIPSRHFTGYCNLDMLHPEVPAGTQIHLTPTGQNNSNLLYRTAEMKENNSIELGPEVSATVLSYDPTDEEKLELYVRVDSGPHKGEKGWLLSFLEKTDDGELMNQFDRAVIVVQP